MLSILIAIILGFLVALGTAILLSPEKARMFPGGSFASGLIVGYSLNPENIGLTIACGVAGVIGWAIYVVISKRVQ